MLKKMMLLATAVAAIAAFAIPASASATDVWLANGETLGAEETATQSYEGLLEFTAPSVGSFGCEVTLTIMAEGPSGGTVTTFAPTTSSCSGTGVFSGCKLVHHTSNIAKGWKVDISATGGVTPASITIPGAFMTFSHVYEGCMVPSSSLSFASITLTPTLGFEAEVEHFHMHGVSTSGATTAGSVEPEISWDILGIESL